MINRRLVNCLPSHLTAIGVEEFAVEQQSVTDDPSLALSANSTSSSGTSGVSSEDIDLWGSWAVYVTFALMGMLVLGAIWGYQKDKRDELNLRKVYMNKEKIYVNLYLEPLPDDQLMNPENDEDDYEAIQQEKQRQLELKRQK